MFSYSTLQSIASLDGKSVTLSPETLKVNEQYLIKNPTVEIGLDNYYNYVTQVLDNGDLFSYSRGRIINDKGFFELNKIVEKDAQVIASLDRMRLAVLHLGLTVKPADESEEAQILKRFWETVLNEMTGTIYDALYQLYWAIVYGYSISEINYKYCDYGEFKGKLIIDTIKNKNTGVFAFDLDQFGNVISIINLYDPMNPLPKGKFIWLTWKPKYENPYGDGIAETLYYLCWAKKQLLKYWLIAKNRNVDPSLYLTLPASPSSQDIEYAKTFISQIRTAGAGVLPETMKAITLGTASGISDSDFLSCFNWLNSEIAKTINLSSAVTSESQKTGAYAARKLEADSSIITEKYLIQVTEDLLKEKLIRKLTPINFDLDRFPLEKYPTICFNPVDTETKESILMQVKALGELGLINEMNEAEREAIRNIVDILPKEEKINMDDIQEGDITEVKEVEDVNSYGFGGNSIASINPIEIVENRKVIDYSLADNI